MLGATTMDFSYRASIPKVECGNLTSSGFLVSSDKVLTALHSIEPYLQREVEEIKVIFINEQGVETSFCAEPLLNINGWEEYEIICLQLNQEAENLNAIHCMDYRFYSTSECFTYGYPPVAKEKGTSIDLEIRNEFKDVSVDYGSNLDIKVKSDVIKDYSGCSGGPLLYNNQAVGIMLEQVSENKEASRLCAVSLYIYKDYLNLVGVPLITKKHEPDYEEYILALKYTLQQQLENNLKRNIEENKINPLGFSISIQPQQYKEEISFNKVLEDDQSVVILSKPGGGKTYLLHMLMLEIIGNPQVSIGKIPIYLKAKEWYRGYENIVEGVKKELGYYLPNIKDEQIIADLKAGKYILLIDGLDEVINNKDLFIGEIRKVSQFEKTKIIMTCRQQNYHNEFYRVFTEYNLKALSDVQIQEYIETVYGEKVHYAYIRELKKQLKDLIENPLFLYMTAHIMKEMTNKVIPKNKSELYEMFVSYIMQERVLKDGTFGDLNFEFEIKEEILMEFAYLNFREKNNSVKFREAAGHYIERKSDLSSIRKEILQTGILLEERDRIDFFHPSIEEYFVALKLSRLPEEEILAYVETNYLNEGYHEVFKFTSGLLRNHKHQNIVLDKLETTDIYLYRQCLESRFNFNNNLDGIWTKEYLEDYFTQMRRSYLNIIDNFFGGIKREFYPWCEQQDFFNNDKVAIVGALDRAKLTLSIEIVRNDDINEKTIIVSEEAGSVKMKTRDQNGNVVSIPIISFQSSNHWYFDLKQTDLGLDSSREVALYIVKNQLKEMLEKERLYNYESPESIVPCIEYVLNSLPSQYFSVRDSNGEVHKVSFEKHPTQLILKVLLHGDNIFKYAQSRRPYGHLNQEFVTGVLMKFFELIDENIEFRDYLLPQADIEPNKDICSSWELWSDERIRERLKKFFEFYQIAYRTLVEQCFSTMHRHMRLYAAGPVKFEIGLEKDEERYSGISIEWVPVGTLEEAIPMLKEEKARWFGDEGFEQRLAKIDQEILRFNRKLIGGHSLQRSMLDLYLFDDKKLRNMIYEEIKKELKYVLGELK